LYWLGDIERDEAMPVGQGSGEKPAEATSLARTLLPDLGGLMIRTLVICRTEVR